MQNSRNFSNTAGDTNVHNGQFIFHSTVTYREYGVSRSLRFKEVNGGHKVIRNVVHFVKKLKVL
jgi:hypothetical protein